jgi:hypothetical protein
MEESCLAPNGFSGKYIELEISEREDARLKD